MNSSNTGQSIRVGLFFIFGLILIWVMYGTLVGKDSVRHSGYTLETQFDDLQQLGVGDEVRLAGIRIGHVRQLRLTENGTAQVTLQIENEYAIPAGTVATVTTAGLLGNNYIALRPGSGPHFHRAGEVIPSKRSADINAVIASVGELGDNLARAFSEMSGTDDNPGLFKNLNSLIGGNRGHLDAIFSNLAEVTQKVNQGTGTLGLLVNDRSLYDEVMQAARGLETVGLAVEDLRRVLAKMDQGEGALGVLLSDPKAAEEMKRMMANFAEFSDKLNSDRSTLGRLIVDDSLYVHAQQVLNRADSALSSMTDSAPISALGVAATALF